MEMIQWMQLLDTLLGDAVSLEQAAEDARKLLPRDNKCGRVFL